MLPLVLSKLCTDGSLFVSVWWRRTREAPCTICHRRLHSLKLGRALPESSPLASKLGAPTLHLHKRQQFITGWSARRTVLATSKRWQASEAVLLVTIGWAMLRMISLVRSSISFFSVCAPVKKRADNLVAYDNQLLLRHQRTAADGPDDFSRIASPAGVADVVMAGVL